MHFNFKLRWLHTIKNLNQLVHCFIDKVHITGLAIVSLTFSSNTGTSALPNMYAQAQVCTAKCYLSIFFPTRLKDILGT